jgi:hypothetical protein
MVCNKRTNGCLRDASNHARLVRVNLNLTELNMSKSNTSNVPAVVTDVVTQTVPVPDYWGTTGAFTMPSSQFGYYPSREERELNAQEAEQEALEAEATRKALALVAAKRAPRAGGTGSKAVKFSSTSSISVLVAANPKRPGSSSAERFALYNVHNTVDAFLKAGGKRIDLDWDVKHGFISIV